MKTRKKSFDRSVLQPLLYGCITGVATGAFLALFLVCSRIMIDFAFNLYAGRDGALAVVCIITLALLCCFLTAIVQTLCPAAKGSGIPLAEGAARGMLRVKWLATAAALVTGSFLAFLSGMPLGSEGPSVGLGGLIGEGVGKTAKKPNSFRRYLITGGASAGLAVAFNAPLTGLCFSFEETHRRFSPFILAAAFSAVVTATLTSQAIFYGFGFIPYLKGLGISAGFTVLSFLKQTAPDSAAHFFALCLAALVCGAVCALLGTAFNRAIKALSALFSKIRTPFLRLLPAFLTAVCFGLVLYLSVGSGEAMLAELTSEATLGVLFGLLAMRFVSTALASGSGATGGLFLPMIAIGGILGCIAQSAIEACGLVGYSNNIIIICICAFFASSVRAPITAIAMSMELTGGFVNLVPCIIAVAAAAVITDLTRTQPLYERMLESLVNGTPGPRGAKDIVIKGVVGEHSPVAFMRVRNVLWPYNSLVTELDRGGAALVPDGETTLLPGDVITVRAENVDPNFFGAEIAEYIDVDPPPSDRSECFGATARNKTR